jgi:hypothetical protein
MLTAAKEDALHCTIPGGARVNAWCRTRSNSAHAEQRGEAGSERDRCVTDRRRRGVSTMSVLGEMPRSGERDFKNGIVSRDGEHEHRTHAGR